MDMRLKIICAVFAVIVIFYLIQMVTGFMNKKEHFSGSYYDDVERYEDAPPTKPYELRIFILDEIEKLNINDKNLKGNVMETLFSETVMNDLKMMSKEQRIERVKTAHKDAHKPAVSAESVVPTPPKTTPEIPKSAYQEPEDDLPLHLPEIKDYYQNDQRHKIKKVSDKLEGVIKGLQDMKGIIDGSDVKETYIQDVPIPPPAPVGPKKELIEGFENVRSFAMY